MDDIRFHRDKAVVTLRGSVDGEAVDRLVRALRSAHEDYFYDRIEISVRSTGGEIDALMEVLRETHRLRERGVTVDTVVRGMAGCGSACVAFLGDHRRADAGSTLYLHGARWGDQANLTALQSVVAGQYLAVWDGNVIEALAERALRTTPPTGGDAGGIDGLDWRVVARVVSAEPPRAAGPTATQRRKLHASLRRTMRGFVSTGDREGLAKLYAGLFERDEQIGAELARELLLLDGVGDEPEAPPESAGEPCLHVPEWRPLWPAGRVPTRLLCRHTLILGETGSGKTMSGVRPLLDALLAPGLPDGTVGCVLVVDPKRELWDVVRDRGARRIDIGGAGGPAVNLMSGDAWDVTADVAAGRYLAAAERVLVRSASLAPLSPANALAGRPSGGYSQYWQTDGARMALTATALTMALLEEGKALFAGGEAAPLKDVSDGALTALRKFGERAGLLMPHPELCAAAQRAITDSWTVAAAHADAGEPPPPEAILRVWETFRAVVEASAIHAALPALRDALRDAGEALRGAPNPPALRRCARTVASAALTRLPDDQLCPAPGLLALADDVLKLLFAPPGTGTVTAEPYRAPSSMEALAEEPDDDEPEEGDKADEPPDWDASADVLRGRLRSVRAELRDAEHRLAAAPPAGRATSAGRVEKIPAHDVVKALAATGGRGLGPLLESVMQWVDLGYDNGRNSHYIGVRAYAAQAFFAFAEPAAAWMLYCGCEPYWRRLVEGGTEAVDFSAAVDGDAGREVFVVQPRGAAQGIVAKAVKALFFEAVLGNARRAAGEKLPLVAYVADEFHRFVTADQVHGEQSFLDTCRSFNAACVLACQSMASVRHALAGASGAADDGRANGHAVDILLANTGSKMFFRTTDPDTLSRVRSMDPARPGEVSVVDARPPSTLRAGECYVSLPDGRFERRQIAAGPAAAPAPAESSGRVVPLRRRRKGATAPEAGP